MNTELFSNINWFAVFLAALAFFMLGALWYSKMLFAKTWIRDTKIDVNDPNLKKRMGITMFSSFVWMFISATAIAILRERIGDVTGFMGGLKLGSLTGLCFGVSAISISYLYEKRPLSLYFINGGYTLFGNILAAIIICLWHN